MIVLKNIEQLDKIRKSCKLVAIGLSEMAKMVRNVLDEAKGTTQG